MRTQTQTILKSVKKILDDIEYLERFYKALADKDNQECIPFEQVKKELKL